MIKKNDDFELTITGYTSEGSGVGKKDGIAVFVENTAKNDVISCHVIKAKKTYAIGKAMKIIRPSKDRTEPLCEHFKYCGGCSFSHLKYAAEASLKAEKVKDAFLRIAHLEPEFEPIIVSRNTERYRNKAQYPIRRENGSLKIGFYAKKSHRVIDGDDCLLEPEEFGKVIEIIRKFINDYSIPVYSEDLHVGLIRHVYLRKAFSTNELMVCVVINGDTLKNCDVLVEELKKVEGFKTLVLNKNTERTNVVLGNECETIYGEGFITDVLCGIKVKLSPLSFYQVNHDTAELLYGKAAEYAALTENDDFLDLYCGTGTIGLSMAKNARSLIGVEIIPDAIKDAKLNAELNNVSNAEFICGDAKDAIKELQERSITPKVVILDPPRKGCNEELLKTVAEISPERIVYVSCDHATLARDAKRLADLGYETKKVTPVDMFPRTSHVETVVLLSRR